MESYAAVAFVSLLSLGAVSAAVLAALVIYRATLSSREDDQLFIDNAEQRFSQEQQIIIRKMSRLKAPIIEFAVISALLLLIVLGGLLT
jgi:hypothetical protein